MTDWDAIYFRVRSSPVGGDFSPTTFVRTPISTIRWLLRQIDDEERGRLNITSMSTAKLASIVVQVAHSFSGSRRQAPKAPPRDFLPFPDWKPSTALTDGPDAPTKFVLSELVRTRRIPLHVYAALASGQDGQP